MAEKPADHNSLNDLFKSLKSVQFHLYFEGKVSLSFQFNHRKMFVGVSKGRRRSNQVSDSFKTGKTERVFLTVSDFFRQHLSFQTVLFGNSLQLVVGP